MQAEIKFEPDGRNGVIATGTYLYDAAKRMGVDLPECERRGETDLCAVEIVSGKNLLSEPTKAELETLGSDRFIRGERLACQAKIASAGEIVVMAKKKKETTEEEQKAEEQKRVEEFRKAFDEMPLEKKVAALVELEAVALNETLSFVINSPFKIFDKLMDVMAQFGLKLEKEEKESKRPAEHKAEEKNGDATEQAADEEESVVEAVETASADENDGSNQTETAADGATATGADGAETETSDGDEKK